MKKGNPITREQVIGKFIAIVFHFDLPKDPKERFQERLVIIELQSGLRFSLQTEADVLTESSKFGTLYPYLDKTALHPVIEFDKEPNLRSPIKSIFIPYEWNNSMGLALENGFVLHEGFSSWDNCADFYLPDPMTIPKLVEFELPS